MRRRACLAIPVAACVLLVGAGCNRSDLHGNATTRSKYNLLNADQMFREPLAGVASTSIPIISEGSAGEGPGNSQTSASQIWRDAEFQPNATTLSAAVAHVRKFGAVRWLQLQCHPGLHSLTGFKQYGTWAASITLYLAPGHVQINANLGVGDHGRGSIDEQPGANEPPTVSSTCARAEAAAAGLT
ncbi:MAG: hypothetical protein QOG53_1836 [Frankiales bacterium]|jgi:hypothetical protein|nr:hypothetical protein [Frankiales bacterium]